MQTIVLATDGSPSAGPATQLAAALADATGWRLRIVSAWMLPAPIAAYTPLVDLPELEEPERRRAELAARVAAAVAREAGVHVTSCVRSGDPVETICAEADASDAALVVIGTRGWSTAHKLLLGSVSLGVLTQASRPVLVVAGDAPLQLAVPRILLATDGSPSARGATSLAIELARATRWPLHAMSAWELPSTAAAYPESELVRELVSVELEHAEEVVEEVGDEANDAAVEASVAAVRGEPVAAIRAEVERIDPTLVVVGGRGWSPLRASTFGSVSNSIVQDAPCPVLVVRGSAAVKRAARRRVAAVPAARR